MNITLQIINGLFALIAIPPSLLLLKVISKERMVVSKKQKGVNKILTALFIGIALGSLINALISIIYIFGVGRLSHNISPYRSLFDNLFFSSISWLLYTYQKSIKRG